MTVRRLVLIRHSKATRDGGADAKRALAKRGVADARAVGRWLAEQGLVPDRVVVSPARRARQTWQLAAAELRHPPEPVMEERIYANTVDDLLGVVRDTPSGVSTLVLVGHNPAMEALAVALDDGRGDPAARQELAQNYPTSGVVVFALNGDWADVSAGMGTVTRFAAPRG